MLQNLLNLLLIFCSLTFFSCVKDDSCRVNYIGVFSIDMNLVSDSLRKEEIQKRSWDSVLLLSGKDGLYYFNTNDAILKQSEGRWYTKSNNIEGTCIGYIQQDNLDNPYSGTFGIIVNVSDSLRFSLPFRKIRE